MYIPFSFYFALFHFVSDFTLSTLVLFHFFTCTFLHFTFFYSPVLPLLLQTQTTPKKGRDITADILDPVLQPDPTLMNRTFWRQNTTLMNRAFWRQNTRIHFTRSAPPLYILDPVLQPDPITFLCI